MDIATRISASFAELRANHFHSGIDLSTVGAINIPVKAAREGYVSRIKIATYGYGYALYVTHPDGNTTVYGHLNALEAKIDKVLCDYQYSHKVVNCDIQLKSDVLPVKRGEIIAYSGNTGGSGGPHLHFEVRDTKSEHPLNPLAYLPKVKDDVAPTIMGVKTYYLDNEGSRAEYRDGKYLANQANAAVEVPAGRVALGVHCTDYFQTNGRPCGVVDIKLYKGDEIIFHSHIDNINFDITREINAHIDYKEWIANKRFIQRSYVLPGNELPYYEGNGIVDISENETMHMRYEVSDFAGHTTKMSFSIVGKRVSQNRTIENRYYWDKTNAIDTLGISVLLPSRSLYADEAIAISQKNNSWVIGSINTPLQKAISITLPLPDSIDGNKACIMSRDAKNKEVYIGGKVSDRSITAKVNTLGQYYVGIDNTAPKVFSKNSRTNLRRTNTIMIGVSDDKSDIAEWEVYIDGEWHPFEYDYKQGMVKARLERLRLDYGKHDLLAIITDGRGNAKRFEWTFSLIQ
ncbi:MAG: M23 family metallopeptidase [Bacteroidia bacterium]|nr:M23 family metallopeptidase [Bacteroidia bacterium]